MVSWTIERIKPAVSMMRIDMNRNSSWEQWGLLSSDRHFDNPMSKRSMQRRHLDMARERDAFILDFGDLFCAMQGKYDKRSSKRDVLPENQREDYLDSLVDSGEKFFGEYSNLFAELGMGNHETSILDRHETNLTERLVKRLKKHGSKAILGGYRGWIILSFKDTKQSNFQQSLNLYYTHGSNSNAPVTKGIIKTNRRSVWLPDANIIVSGHIHEAWLFPIPRSRITDHGNEYMDKQVHIQLPTYKDEFFGASTNSHHKQERPPKPLGAWWLRFFFDRGELSGRIKFEASQAE